MPSYNLYSRSQDTFLAFLDSPTDEQLSFFVEQLSADDQATSYFEDEPRQFSRMDAKLPVSADRSPT